jgi:hypothetical protein
VDIETQNRSRSSGAQRPFAQEGPGPSNREGHDAGRTAEAMNAEELTVALGGRWNGRAGLAPCPAHPDRNPSLSIAEKGGRTVFICRSGCRQPEVIHSLMERGLWANSSGRVGAQKPTIDWVSHVPIEAPIRLKCCLRGPENGFEVCQHWRASDADMMIERLHAKLRQAADEVVALFKTARIEITEADLRDELNLAVDLARSAIVPFHMTGGIVEKMIAVTAAEVLGYAARPA